MIADPEILVEYLGHFRVPDHRHPIPLWGIEEEPGDFAARFEAQQYDFRLAFFNRHFAVVSELEIEGTSQITCAVLPVMPGPTLHVWTVDYFCRAFRLGEWLIEHPHQRRYRKIYYGGEP
jgi:hypothetical protein